MQSSNSWEGCFLRDGYFHFPKLIDPSTLLLARTLIDDDRSANYDVQRQVEYDNRSACPDLLGHPLLLDLFRDRSLQERLERLVDPDQVSVDDGQIAIRQAHNTEVSYAPIPHIDGIPTATNGMAGDELTPFTLLVGIFLTDVTRAFAGNFTVWPGSHIVLEHYFNERGHRAKREGMPQVPLGLPTQLLCSAGDTVVCHYNLAHAAAVNTSDSDRFAVFFRVTHRELLGSRESSGHDFAWEHLTSIWTGWKISPSQAS